jgi:GAF domain-containing protein
MSVGEGGNVTEWSFDGLDDLEPDTFSALQRLGRALHLAEADVAATLDAVVQTAVQTIDNAAFASVNLIRNGAFVPQAAAGEPPHALDAYQQEHGHGPCAEASTTQLVVRVDDTETEQRWELFGKTAVTVGVLSMLCIPLWVDDRQLGSLSLYAERPRAFDANDERLASLFATHAALALAEAQRATNLRAALVNRDLIGQAKGILMERNRSTADQAFALLSQTSQHTNRKLIAVAEHLVSTGELPG